MEDAASALAGGTSQPYNEAAVLQIVADTIREGLDNGRIIAERLNNAEYQTKMGKTWDKDIYSAWKHQGNNGGKVATLLS